MQHREGSDHIERATHQAQEAERHAARQRLSQAGEYRAEQPQKGHWQDIGIQEVPLSQIDLSDSPVHSQGDFHKVSYDDMAHGLRTLEGMKPEIARGANADYFADQDRRAGLPYPYGRQRIYEAFYGQEAIRLNQQGNRYTVVNGYHRLCVAKDLGLQTVPARVIAYQQA